MVFNVIVLVAQQHFIMINARRYNYFCITPREFTEGDWDRFPFSVILENKDQSTPLASWFPQQLHTFHFGNLNLFEILAGPEKDLGPKQKELREWFRFKAQKSTPLKFRTLVKTSGDLSKEEVARKIIDHIKTGAKGVFFPLSLPAEYLINKSSNSRSNRTTAREFQYGACFPPNIRALTYIRALA
jgi:hypothetical protein